MRVKVSKDGIVANVDERVLKSYLDNGWEVVVENKKPIPTTYDRFTDKQLDDIAKARGINVEGLDTSIKIETLTNIDKQLEKLARPTNKGFTDDLIIVK